MSARTRRRARKRNNEVVEGEVAMTAPIGKKNAPVRTAFPAEEVEAFLVADPAKMVDVQTQRVAPGGTLAGLRGAYNLKIPLKFLASIPEKIAEIHGGGKFRIRTRDIESGAQIIPSWDEVVEGPQRALPNSVHVQLIYDDINDKLTVVGKDAADRPIPLIGGTVDSHIKASQPQFMGPGPGASSAPPWAPQAQPAVPPFPQPQFAPNGQMQPPPPDLGWGSLPAWVIKQPPNVQWDWARDLYKQQFGLDPTATQVALQRVQDQAQQTGLERAQNARLESTIANLSAQLDTLRSALVKSQGDTERQRIEYEARQREQQAALERERSEQRTNAQMAELRAMLAARDAAPKPTVISPELIGTIVTVAGSLATAYMTANATTRQAEMEATQKQHATLLATIAKPQPIPPPQPSALEQMVPLITALAPILAPIATQFIANGDPRKIAEARLAMSTEQQASIQLLAGLIKELTPQDNEPWWAGPVVGMLDKLAGGAAAMAAQAQLQAPQQAPMLPAERQPVEAQSHVVQERQVAVTPTPVQQTSVPQQQQAQSSGPPSVGDLDGLLRMFAAQDPQAAQYTQLVFQAIMRAEPVDSAWLTNEWLVLVFNLHARTEPEKLAELFVGHLEHCRDFALMPAALRDIFTEPKATLERGLHQMPIAMIDRAYVDDVIARVAEQIETDEREADMELDADPEDDEGAEDDPRALEEEAAEE